MDTHTFYEPKNNNKKKQVWHKKSKTVDEPEPN